MRTLEGVGLQGPFLESARVSGRITSCEAIMGEAAGGAGRESPDATTGAHQTAKEEDLTPSTQILPSTCLLDQVEEEPVLRSPQ